MRVDEVVDAIAEFKVGLSYPLVKAIKWNHQRIDFSNACHVEKAGDCILYRIESGTARYQLRFRLSRQQWILEDIDDSGVAGESSFPPPRVFAPTNWKR